MFNFPEFRFRRGLPTLRRYTVPLACLTGLGLGLLLPNNPRLENSLNRTFPARLDPRIVLVGIDDASLRDYGRLEVWPRALYAQALRNLNEAGAKVVGLDVLLSDPAPGDEPLLAAFNQPGLVRSVTPEDYLSQAGGPDLRAGVSVLNAPKAQGVSEVQTAYATTGPGPLLPSFAAQVARASGKVLPPSTAPQLLAYVPADKLQSGSVSFRDVVNGNFRFADVQGRTVLIGVTANGLGSVLLPDLDGRPVPGVLLQARAVSTLLGPPFERPALWWTALLCVVVGGVVVLAQGYWGFVLAGGVLLLSALSWQFRLVLPGVTLSLTAVVGSALVASEQWWLARQLSRRDPLTGVGNRLALSSALEKRWPGRAQRPVSVLLVDVNELRRVDEQYGRLASEKVLRELGRRLEQAAERRDQPYRWGPEEFAVLLRPGAEQQLAALAERYEQACTPLRYGELSLSANIGAASTGAGILTPGELLEAASRNRYRLKYEREHQQSAPLRRPGDLG